MKALVLLTLVSLQTISAATIVVFNNGGPNGVDGAAISSFVAAEDFVLAANRTLTGVLFYGASDSNDVPSQFSGTIGWGIFTNSSSQPGALLFSGSDNSVVLLDNHTLNVGTEEYTFHVNLGSVSLSPGTYWLGLHEGALGTPGDGTAIYWDTTGAGQGANAKSTGTLTGLGGWTPTGDGTLALAFQLEATDAPEPSTWALAISVLALLLMRRRFRRLR